jgi:hypothetical protein
LPFLKKILLKIQCVLWVVVKHGPTKLNEYFYKYSDPIASRGGVIYGIEKHPETGELMPISQCP